MRGIHQLTESVYIFFGQRLNSLNGSLILIHGMLCTTLPDRIINHILVGLKRFFRQVSQTFDIHNGLQLCKRFFTLTPAVIVCGIHKTMFHFAVGHNDFRTIQYKGCILIGEIRRIQENSMVFFAHGRSKLVHDTTIHSVEIVLGILSDQGKVYIGHVKPELITQGKTCQHLQ